MPIRKGGSTEASASLLTRESDSIPVVASLVASKPDQLALPPFRACHLAALKRGLGNLRMPSAPVEVPNFRSQAEWR